MNTKYSNEKIMKLKCKGESRIGTQCLVQHFFFLKVSRGDSQEAENLRKSFVSLARQVNRNWHSRPSQEWNLS